jgi:hypothetical protein
MAKFTRSPQRVAVFKQASAPTVAGGLRVGDLWIDTSGTPAVKVCTDTAGPTFAAVGGGSGDALTSDPLSQFASTTSLQLKGVISDETGSGALVFADTPTLVTPDLGTPSAGTLTSCTGLPISTGVSGLGSNVATFLATPSSANLASAVTDETGSGALVFADTPTLVTPTLGVATATSVNKVAITAPASSATLTIADGKTLTASNTLTFTGTDSSSVAFGAGGTAVYEARTISAAGLATGGGDLSANRTITVTAADQATMETATSTTTVVVPNVQKNHPAHPKAFIQVANTGTPSTEISYGITSISDEGTGITRVTLSTATNAGLNNGITCVTGLATNNASLIVSNPVSSTVSDIYTFNSSFAATDISFYAAFFGDQ